MTNRQFWLLAIPAWIAAGGVVVHLLLQLAFFFMGVAIGVARARSMGL